MAVIQLRGQDYLSVVDGATKPVLLDFYADWCGPCRMLAPILEEVAENYSEDCVFCRINVDGEPELAAKFGISVIPTLIRIENGEKTDESTGYLSKEELLAFLRL